MGTKVPKSQSLKSVFPPYIVPYMRTRNNEEYNSFLSGAGAIDPTDPAAAAASKMQNLVLFLIQVDLASTYVLRDPSP